MSCQIRRPAPIAAALGGRLDRRDRRPALVTGEHRAERDARSQADAAEEHDDHDLPEHALNVLRFAMMPMPVLMAQSGGMENHLDPRLSSGVRIGDLIVISAIPSLLE